MGKMTFCIRAAGWVVAALLSGCGGGGSTPAPGDVGNLAAPTGPADNTSSTAAQTHQLNRTHRLQYKEAVAKLGGGAVASPKCSARDFEGGLVPGSISIISPSVLSSDGSSFEFLNAVTNDLSLMRTRESQGIHIETLSVSVEGGMGATLQRFLNVDPASNQPANSATITDHASRYTILLGCSNDDPPQPAGGGAIGAFQEAFVKFKNQWPPMLNCSKAITGSSTALTYQPNLQLSFEMGAGSIRLGDIIEVVSTGNEILKVTDGSAKHTQPTYEYTLKQNWIWSIGMDDQGYLQHIRVGKVADGVTTAYDCNI